MMIFKMDIGFLDFHCLAIKNNNANSQNKNSRIWEMKEDKYTKSLAKNQVCVIIHVRDIR